MKRLFIPILILLLPVAFFSAQAQTTASGESEIMRGFGQAVAIYDDLVFISEPQNVHQPGIVYVYSRTDEGWSEEFQLKASDGKIGDSFGSSLVAGKDIVLISAPGQADGNGAVYAFKRMADGTWSETERIALPDSIEGSRFGTSIALEENRAFVGAPRENEGLGGVHVFRNSNGDSWTHENHIAYPDTTDGTNFGASLTVENNKLMIGAPSRNGGAVYVFNNNADGSWTQEEILTNNRISGRAGYGAKIGLHGNKVFISAPGQSSASGVVFVYRFNEETGGWQADGRLVAYDSEPRYLFGSSMAFVGDNIWIGAPRADGGTGAIYQFEWDEESNDWAGVKKFAHNESESGDQFAGTFAVSENIAVVGLVGADYGAGTAAIMEQNASGEWDVKQTVISDKSSVLEPITGKKVKCKKGKADRYGCDNVNLLSFLPIDKIGGERGVRLNDIWGWTDPQTGKEYALIGRNEGTSFVDVSDPYNPIYVGNLPMPETAQASVWRDIKVYKNHAYIVADNADRHGMQVVDLTDLREFDGTPIQFDLAAHYNEIHSAHNIVINEDSGFAYAVGSSGGGKTCGGGLHMINIQDPKNPAFAGCFADPSTGRSGTGYSHDAQCVIYDGPDADYKGREICIGANETAISIADVTDKENPKAISTVSYPDYGYVHQGWFTDDQRYFFQNDELDELAGNVDSTRTLVWDFKDLDDPQFVREYMLDNPATDHNLYIDAETMYQSNYVSGLQIIDVSDPEAPKKVGYFDTHPFTKDEAGFAGTWSNYPFFKSGIVIMNSSREGFFVLETKERKLEL